jgi:alkyldihydroxyacetonephosphate synthase
MMYPFVYNEKISSPDEIPELYYQLMRAAMDAVKKVGDCTINHHHGVGFRLGGFMKDEYGPVGHEMYQNIKKTLDPNNIMNPGIQGLEWR